MKKVHVILGVAGVCALVVVGYVAWAILEEFKSMGTASRCFVLAMSLANAHNADVPPVWREVDTSEFEDRIDLPRNSEGVPLDYWGRPVAVQYEALTNGSGTIFVQSMGADGIAGTEDDVKSLAAVVSAVWLFIDLREAPRRYAFLVWSKDVLALVSDDGKPASGSWYVCRGFAERFKEMLARAQAEEGSQTAPDEASSAVAVRMRVELREGGERAVTYITDNQSTVCGLLDALRRECIRPCNLKDGVPEKLESRDDLVALMRKQISQQ